MDNRGVPGATGTGVDRARRGGPDARRGPIGFEVENLNPQAGGAVVYLSTDPRWGRLAIWLRNDSDDVIAATPATEVRVYFDPLLSDAEVAELAVASGDWARGAAPAPGGACLVLHPVRTVTMLPGDQVSIEIDGALAAGPLPCTGYFRCAYSGIPRIADGTQRVQGFRQAPPTTGKAWPVGFGFAPRAAYHTARDTIYVTPWPPGPEAPGIGNAFVLQVDNQASNPLAMPAGAPPRFVVSFVGGDSEAALASDEQVKRVTAAITQSDPGAVWHIRKNDTSEIPVFEIVPDPANPVFLDAGGVLAVEFSGLVSTLDPDFASTVFVQYAGLTEDYDDGYTGVLLNKVLPVPYVNRFQVFSGATPIPPGGTVNYEPLTLEWDVFASRTCAIKGNPAALGPTGSLPVAPAPTVQFTLEIESNGQTYDGPSVSLTVTPPTASLQVLPAMLYPGAHITLSWACGNGASCAVFANDAEILSDQGLTGTHDVVFEATTTYRVDCVGAGKASGSVTLDMPAPVASISASGSTHWVRHTTEGSIPYWFATATWNTGHAVSCQVTCAPVGQISTALNGSWSGSGYGEWPVAFEITASGAGTATSHFP